MGVHVDHTVNDVGPVGDVTHLHRPVPTDGFTELIGCQSAGGDQCSRQLLAVSALADGRGKIDEVVEAATDGFRPAQADLKVATATQVRVRLYGVSIRISHPVT